ncbi:MAG TPA: response regulator [Methylomirabilota bacterium]|nr:response regulator [Methylomirabilota bacterium]
MNTALVVDDDDSFREMLALAFRVEGFEVHAAQHGRAALDILKTQRNVNVLVTDITMPVMDGFELIRATRKAFPHIPIIAITAGGAHYTAFDSLKVSEALGACATLQKPFNLDELFTAVRNALAGNQEPREG